MNTIKKEDLEKILNRADLNPSAVRRNESYRGTYGRSVLGLKLFNTSEFARFFAAAGRIEAEQDADDEGYPDGPTFSAQELAQGVYTDASGLGLVLYWPGLKLED